MSPGLARNLNALGLLAVCLVLLLAFWFQRVLGELPCPLCLLQRVGFVAVGFGLCLNLLWGSRPHHYGIMLLGALFGGAVAVRQVLLHIVPGTGHYGSPMLGLHYYYTWSLIFFVLLGLGTALMLLFDRQFEPGPTARFGGSFVARLATIVFLVVAGANAVSALLECGPGICDDPPTDYKFYDAYIRQ